MRRLAFIGGDCPNTIEQNIPASEDGPERDVEIVCGWPLEYQPGERGDRWHPPVAARVWCDRCGWEADDPDQWLDDGSDAAYDDWRDERDA